MSFDLDEIYESIEEILDDLFEQDEIIVQATYQLYTTVAPDAELKRNVTTFTPYTVRALDVRKMKARGTLGGQVFSTSRGDYVLLASECPADLSNRDKIEINGITYQLADVQPVMDLAWIIAVEGRA
jgi:hypothetical protein